MKRWKKKTHTRRRIVKNTHVSSLNEQNKRVVWTQQTYSPHRICTAGVSGIYILPKGKKSIFLAYSLFPFCHVFILLSVSAYNNNVECMCLALPCLHKCMVCVGFYFYLLKSIHTHIRIFSHPAKRKVYFCYFPSVPKLYTITTPFTFDIHFASVNCMWI